MNGRPRISQSVFWAIFAITAALAIEGIRIQAAWQQETAEYDRSHPPAR